MTASEPVPIVDPGIEVLTFEQLAQLVNEVSPDSFYGRAQAFDTAMAQFEQVQDNLARGTRELWDAWRGEGADSFADVVRNVSTLGNTVIQAMASPGYGATLRRAGDALALAQQRIRDLQAQKRESDLPAARQVVNELGIAYQEIGSAITPFPGAETEIPMNGQGPATNSTASDGATPATGTVQPPAGDGRYGDVTESHSGGIMPAAALVPLGGPMAQGQPGRQGDVWAGLLGDTPQGRSETVTSAVLGKGTSVTEPHVDEGTVDGQQNGAVVAVLGRVPGGQDGSREPERKKKQKQKDGCEDESATTEPDEPQLTPEAPKADLTSSGDAALKTDLTADADESAPSVSTVSAKDSSPTTPAAPQPVESKAPAPAVAPATSTVPSPTATAGAPAPAEPAVQPEAVTPPVEALEVPPLPHGSGAGLPGNATPMSLGTPAQPVVAPVVAPVGGETSLPGALPASPAFRPVTGGFDASATHGIPPVVPGGTGSPRMPGEAMHGGGGGFMSPMLGGGVSGGHDTDNERQPAGLLGVDPKVWEGSGNAHQVLGRPAAAPPPRAGDLDDAKKRAMEMVDSVLGRSDEKDEDRAPE
ncbi:hypothetical protein [Amycolatopsis sp. NPDC102389]|uniref:hypothetical protein n=1 Tax=Amycolatopsis sp. NPDC102389 TaxID=3363941 RepID=UPI003813650A